MNFPSCNRLVLEKQQQKNINNHKLKLEQIKQRDSKSTNRIYYKKCMNRSERNQSVQNQKNKSSQKIILQNQQIEMPSISTKKTKYLNPFFKQPNLHQKSMYCVKKMDMDWKKHCQHFLIASKRRSFPLKQNNTYQCLTSSKNKDSFQNNLKLFQQYQLQFPKEEVFLFPENLVQRIILFKKSVVILQTPYLIQISTAYSRVFIIAYNMSSRQNKLLRLVLHKNTARQIFQQYDYDLNLITLKIGLQNSKLYIKTLQKQQEQSQVDQVQQQSLIQKQNKFINRNYYRFIKHIKHQNFPQINKCVEKQQTINNFSSKNKQSKSRSRSNRTTTSKLFDLSNGNKQYSMASTLKKFTKYPKLNSLKIQKFQSIQHKLNKIFSVPEDKDKHEKTLNQEHLQKHNAELLTDHQIQLKIQKQQNSIDQQKQQIK